MRKCILYGLEIIMLLFSVVSLLQKKNCVHGAEEVAGRQAANSDFFQKQKAHTFLSLAPKKKGRFLFSQLDAANQFPVSTFEYFYGRKWASEIAGAMQLTGSPISHLLVL